MSVINEITNAWGWTGLVPVDVVGENDFGNLIVRDVEGRYWRVCPEDLYCRVIARDRPELDALSTNQEFLGDWYMRELVDKAAGKFGPLPEGRKYCLKIPGPLGASTAEIILRRFRW